MRHAAKVDNNHAEIRDALRKIPGMAVLDTSAMSGLGCDLLCSWQAGPPVMLEVKSSRRAALTRLNNKRRLYETPHPDETAVSALRTRTSYERRR